MNLNNWEIVINEDKENTLNILLEEFCDINDKTKLFFWLDVNKKEFTIFEKLIYDIAEFHFKRLGLDISDNDYFIECWTHYRFCSGYTLHIDVDEPEYKKNKTLYLPFLTTLTYFNDIKNPTMLLDVTEEKYLTNNYKNSDTYFCFPKMLRHISFEGNKYYHGAINYFNDSDIKNERYILGMNFWKKPLAFVEKYNFNIYKNHSFRFKNLFYIDKHYKIFSFESKNKVKTIIVDHDILSHLENKSEHKFFIRGLGLCKDAFNAEFSGLIKEEELQDNDVFKICIKK